MMSDAESNPSASRPGSTAWLVVGLLWPVALLNYLDRQMISTMKRSIMADLTDIHSEARFGLLMAVFMWVYAGLSPVGGLVADRFDRRRVVVGSLAVWSLVTWITGQAHTFDQLLWARALMGVSEAFYMPAALALISDHHFGTTRSRAIGWHQTGIYAGQALGGLTGSIADGPHGWRAAFVWFGLAGVGYSVLLFLGLAACKPRAATAGATDGQGPTPKVGVFRALAGLIGIGSFLLLVVHFTLPAMSGWMIRNWMPTYLGEIYHLKQGPAGLSATLWVTLASVVGALVGGLLADRWMRSTQRGRILASAVGVGMLVVALLAIGHATSLAIATAALVLWGFGWGFFDTNNMPILCQIVRPELRATGFGILNLISISFGAGVTWGLGALRDQKVPIVWPCIGLALAAGVSIFVVLAIRPKSIVETR
jgi:MFS family permease